VLSISGYHMAVVAAWCSFAVRALLALDPGLDREFSDQEMGGRSRAVRRDLLLLLSGAEVATQRSFLMTAVVLIAVMVDRRAVTFRTLAVAAMIVLRDRAGSAGASELSDVVRANPGPGGPGADRHARLFATPDSSTTAKVALWAGANSSPWMLASLVAGFADHAVLGVSFPSRGALRRARQSGAMPVSPRW